MLEKGKLGDNESYEVATQDDINYYLHDVGTDWFVKETYSVLVECQQEFAFLWHFLYKHHAQVICESGNKMDKRG